VQICIMARPADDLRRGRRIEDRKAELRRQVAAAAIDADAATVRLLELSRRERLERPTPPPARRWYDAGRA
jgi:hypothetical protein